LNALQEPLLVIRQIGPPKQRPQGIEHLIGAILQALLFSYKPIGRIHVNPFTCGSSDLGP